MVRMAPISFLRAFPYLTTAICVAEPRTTPTPTNWHRFPALCLVLFLAVSPVTIDAAGALKAAGPDQAQEPLDCVRLTIGPLIGYNVIYPVKTEMVASGLLEVLTQHHIRINDESAALLAGPVLHSTIIRTYRYISHGSFRTDRLFISSVGTAHDTAIIVKGDSGKVSEIFKEMSGPADVFVIHSSNASYILTRLSELKPKVALLWEISSGAEIRKFVCK